MKRTQHFSALLLIAILLQTGCKQNEKVIYESDQYRIFSNRVEQSGFNAVVVSPTEMTSSYRSPDADKYSPNVQFKFSINLRDNEMVPGK
ncbi:MAG: hypothetical protein Q8N05_05800, partial [Bacteroidota bacterium]|nr:hypothetical protein [Bacteroidota bacterium]